MGQYVYRVTSKKIDVAGVSAQVAIYAYKPSCDDTLNRKMAFRSGCFAQTKIVEPNIALVSSNGAVAQVFANPTALRTFLDDSTLGTARLPFVAKYYLVWSSWVAVSELDAITKFGTGFSSFEDLLCAAGNYRPTIQAGSFKGAEILAAAYDAAQESRGDPRRAFGRGTSPMRKTA